MRPSSIHTFRYGLPELGGFGGRFALLFHRLHHLIQAIDLLCGPWTCVIISDQSKSHGVGHTGVARITERQVPLKPVAACRRGTLQSIADLHPT